MKDETRDFMIRIRVNPTELYKIKLKAKKSGKNISSFMRESALGCEIKERPDRTVYDLILKPLSAFIESIKEVEKKTYFNEKIYKEILDEEIKKWQEYRRMIRERLW